MPQPKYQLVVITHSFFPAIGGVETFIDHFLSKLDKTKYNINIFTADINLKKKLKRYQHHELNVYTIRSFTIGGIVVPISFKDMFVLVKHLKSADFVHQHDIKFLSSFLCILSFFFPFRLLLFSHGYMYHSSRFPLFKKMFMSYFSLLSKRYSKVINVSHSDYKLATQYSFNNSVFIKEAVNLSRFSRNPKKEQRGNFLFFGRITGNKGLEHLFNCLAKLSGFPYTLTLIGNGEKQYVRELKQSAERLGITDQLVWKHNVSNEDLLSHISVAEIIFLPSLYEGFGISLLESIASNTKVMAQPNEAYTAMLTDLALQDYLFDFKQPHSFPARLNFIREQTTVVCEKLALYDHDNMVGLIESAHFV